MRRKTLIIMVKEPRPGRVKTRLAKDIGATRAAWWYRHQTRHLLRRLSDPRWNILLCVAPDTAVTSPVWPLHFQRMAQGGGDLGQRMSVALGATTGPTVLIGSDIPGVTRAHIAAAFRCLGAAASVVGPAEDGGFWLVGLHMPHCQTVDLFQGVRWSHPKTLEDALPTLPAPVAVTACLKDVDTVRDL